MWGTRRVKKGFVRAFGPRLRQVIGSATKNRIQAFISGLGVTTLLQSSTATTLLLISFAKSGIVTLSAALAIVIGADVGTTLVAQILSFDLSWLSPAFISLGVILYIGAKDAAFRANIALVFIGLGLMLLSLQLIREAVVPIKQSELLPVILETLGHDILFTIILAGLLTWLVHSSLATVLLFASFIDGGLIDIHLGMLLILGANLGGAFIPLSVTWKDGAPARRITLANLAMRTCCILLALPLLPLIQTELAALDNNTMRQAIHFHTAFNIGLAAIFLPFTSLISRLFMRLLPDSAHEENIIRPHYLDERALDTPTIALSMVRRETLAISERIQMMLEDSIKAFKTDNRKFIDQIRNDDDAIDILYRAVKIYLAKLSQESMTEEEANRTLQALTFATNLEHIGDVIDKNLMELAEKRMRKQEKFSDEGLKEIENFQHQVLENLRLAQNVFMSQDKALAQQLLDKKKVIREAAQETTERHFKRLIKGVDESLATTSLHLDIIRDYQRINSYITNLAYTVLEH